MLPAPQDLEYFLETASTGNISRAAERLGITQPSLSLSLQRLEQNVGAALLNRSRKGVTLTPAGKRVAHEAKKLIQDWQNVKSQAKGSHSEVMGRFVLGCHPSVALYSLGRFLPKLFEDFPEIELKLEHDLSRKITEAIISREIDLGIVVNPVRHPDLIIRRLYRDEVSIWTKKRASQLQNPGRESSVLICDPDLTQTQDIIRRLKLKPGVRFLHTSNLEVIAELVASGAGFGILPALVAQREKSRISRLASAPVYHDEICLAFRAENRSIRAIQEISSRIQETF